MKDHEKLSKRYLFLLILIHVVHGLITNIKWFSGTIKTGTVPIYSLFDPGFLIVFLGTCFLLLPLSFVVRHHAKAAGKQGIRVFSIILSGFYIFFILLYLLSAFISFCLK